MGTNLNKKLKHRHHVLFVILMILILRSFPVAAQELREEVQERALEKITEVLTPAEIAEEERALKGKWTSNLRLSYGYDTNSKLSLTRKGDHFETFRYALNYRKVMLRRNQINVAMDLNQVNYNEITDLTNSLAHFRFEYKGAFSKNYILGLGYDVSLAIYALNASSDYYFHKFFTYVQYRINKNFYHQLQYEFGWKLYDEARALLTATNTFQDNYRLDVREGVDYSFGYTISDKFSSNFRIKTYFNNSNSFFQDYHDYHSHEVTPRLNYKINDKLSANTSFTYTHKEYTSRLVSNGNFEQIDRTYVSKVGTRYRFNDRLSLMLDYTYRENNSNDLLSDYTGSTIEGTWRYIF